MVEHTSTDFHCNCKSVCKSKSEHDKFAQYEDYIVCHMCGTDTNIPMNQRRSMRRDCSLFRTASDTECYQGLIEWVCPPYDKKFDQWHFGHSLEHGIPHHYKVDVEDVKSNISVNCGFCGNDDQSILLLVSIEEK